MLDSGAFTVWSKGESIDLDAYIAFCHANPHTSYYVALDVIPGKPRDVRSKTPSSIAASCQAGWDNYQRMIETLPVEKVIPVFHQGDDFAWLVKYLEFGTPYIGISPANDRTTTQKMQWMRTVKPLIFDNVGRPLIKTHGFAVTSYALMKYWQWHSVDSASWMSVASYGGIYVPKLRGGKWAFDETPWIIGMSAKSPSAGEHQFHYTGLSPIVKKTVDRWCEECGVKLGRYEIVDVPPGYKRDLKCELWFDDVDIKRQAKAEKKAKFVRDKPADKPTQIMRILERGTSTCHNQRRFVNIQFMEAANEVLPVDHIYFAGNTGNGLYVEKACNRRLISYYWTILGKGACDIFERHHNAVRRSTQCA